jgi:hypothetical protein
MSSQVSKIVSSFAKNQWLRGRGETGGIRTVGLLDRLFTINERRRSSYPADKTFSIN